MVRRGTSTMRGGSQGEATPLTSAWRHTPLGLKLSVVASTLATLTIALRPQPQLLWHPFIEDAYYAFSVSRSLAGGNGLTVDGVTWTNGFQPLTTVLYAIPFLGPLPDTEALRVILIVQWLTLIAGAILVGLIVRTYLQATPSARYGFSVGFLSYLGSFYVINTALNGLETGTLLLGYAALWRFMQVRGVATASNAAWFGLIAGVIGLIRIDSLVILSIVLLAVLVQYGLRSALIAGIVSGLVVSPWLLYGFVLTGSPVPSSGRAQTAIEFSAFRVERILEAVSATGFPWLPISSIAPGLSTPIRLIFLFFLLVAFVVLSRRLHPSSIMRRTESFAALLLIGVLAIAVYYGVTSFAFWFYGRYLAPLVLVAAFLLAVVLILIGRTVMVLGAAVLTATALAASIAHWIPGFYQENTMLTEQVALVNEVVPPEVTVSASQTGTLGFFRPATVNLDGKVNNEVLIFDGTTDEYLQERSIEWMCDWPRQLQDYLGAARDNWVEIAAKGEYICISRSVRLD